MKTGPLTKKKKQVARVTNTLTASDKGHQQQQTKKRTSELCDLCSQGHRTKQKWSGLLKRNDKGHWTNQKKRPGSLKQNDKGHQTIQHKQKHWVCNFCVLASDQRRTMALFVSCVPAPCVWGMTLLFCLIWGHLGLVSIWPGCCLHVWLTFRFGLAGCAEHWCRTHL